MSASDVRIHARYVRSLARVKRTSGSSPTSRASARGAIEQAEEARLVEDGDAEALSLLELRARRRAGDDVVGLLRHRRRHAAAGARDPLGRVLAREVGQRAGEHERPAAERPLAGRRALALELRAERAQVLDQRAQLRAGELRRDRLGHLRPDAGRLRDLLRRRGHERVDRAELLGEVAAGDEADLLEADREQDDPERLVLRARDRVDEPGRADLSESLERGELLDGQAVEVPGLADEPRLVELEHALLAEALDVHRPARGEVLEKLELLARTAGAVRALREDGALGLDDRRAARRAALGRPGGRSAVGALDRVRRRREHLRDDIARAQHDRLVAGAQVLARDVLLVVQRRELHRDAADVHRLEY